MKRSRKAAVLAVALALLATGCSRFAPKAGVGVKGVSVDLAFGIDVEDLLKPTPTQTPTLPTLPPPTTPTPTQTPTIEPPPAPLCPPSTNLSTKDGAAPSTIRNQDFKREPSNQEGSRPREGTYFSWLQFNFSSDEVQEGYTYRDIDHLHDSNTIDGAFAYDLLQPEVGHAIDVSYLIVPQPEETGAGGASADVAGLYIQELSIPFKERPRGPIQKRTFTVFEPGTRLVEFPIANGNRSSDSQPVPDAPDTSSGTPVIGGAANVLSITSVVGERDRVFVCDELADTWRVSVTMEITGDVDVRLVGNFWIAPQYGGWPIQEAFTIDGGSDFVSGNFFSRLARLDPGEIV